MWLVTASVSINKAWRWPYGGQRKRWRSGGYCARCSVLQQLARRNIALKASLHGEESAAAS